MPAASVAKAKAKTADGGATSKRKPPRGKENKRPRSPCTAEKEARGSNKKKSKVEDIPKTEPSNSNKPETAGKKRESANVEEPGNAEAALAPKPEEAPIIKRMRPRQQGGRVFPEEFFRERCGEATSAAPFFIERRALYPRPVVGRLECVYVGFDVSKDAIKADTEVHFEWRYSHKCSNGQVIQGTTAHANLADWLIYKKIAMLPPRAHVNACVAALVLDRLVVKRKFVPFFDKVPSDHAIEILALGVSKPTERVPQTRAISLKNRLHECILCAHVTQNVVVVHPGAKHRHGTCAYYSSALQEVDLDCGGVVADDGEAKMEKKKRKKSHGFDSKGERTPPPTALKDINESNGLHNGLLSCLAAAHALAEISRAKLQSRGLDVAEACARLERNPFAWQKHDCKRMVVLWRETSTDGQRVYHVTTNSMYSLIKWCRGERGKNKE